MEEIIHCENCAYWQDGYCVLLKKEQTTVAVVKKQYQIIKPKHGYYKGECLDAEIASTIDTGVGCWHTLIGEVKEQKIKCEVIGLLNGGGYERMHDIARRVYGTDGLATTMHTCGGGNLEPKILEPQENYVGVAVHPVSKKLEFDGYKDTVCPTLLVTDYKCPKTVAFKCGEPLAFDEQNRQGDRVYDENGIACALNAQPLGNTGGYSYLYQTDYRIRKFTEKECGRLMGVKDEDCEKIAKNQSTSSQYHLYGDSICVSVLMAIFGSLFGIENYNEKIENLVNELRQGD